MTDAEAIAAVKAGQRAVTSTTRKADVFGNDCGARHAWRTVACDDETDVIECWHCGKQQLSACNFDEDHA